MLMRMLFCMLGALKPEKAWRWPLKLAGEGLAG
jgi:hypothetical protein